MLNISTHSKAIPSLIVLILSSILILSTVNATKKMCNPSHRLPLDSCSQDFKNMCAFFSGKDCDSKTCARLTSNQCTACADPNVLYYFDQPCPNDKVYCDATLRPTQCTAENAPVCAFTEENCSRDSCRKSFSDGCQACQDPSVLYYNTEECPALDEKFECDIFDLVNIDCSGDQVKPVCAYFTEQCGKEICSTTVFTACEACLDAFILYYKEGECEPEPDQRKYCLPENRPTECLVVSEPVCGFSSIDCEGEICGKEYQNECSACQDDFISYYIPGICNNSLMINKASLVVPLSQSEMDLDRIFQQESCVGCDIKSDEEDGEIFFSEEENFQ